MPGPYVVVHEGRLELTWSSMIPKTMHSPAIRARLRVSESQASLPNAGPVASRTPAIGRRISGPWANLRKTVPAALQVPGILLSIFQYLNPRALLGLARVCRLWSYIFLDIIWQDLPTATPLLKLYGLRFSKSWTENDVSTDEWDFGRHGPRVPTKRQQMYLPSVRSLAIRRNREADVKMLTLHQLSRIEFRLPNLEILDFKINANTDDDFLGVIPFIMPTLKSLTLPPLFMIPGRRSPRFLQLLDSLHNTPGLSLEYLDVSGIVLEDDSLIEALGSLVRQQTSLRHLAVMVSNTELFASALNRSGRHSPITSLKIWRHSRDFLPMDNLGFVRPLFQFAGLEAIDLGTSMTPAEIKQNDITAMASAWPNLRQLRLRGIWGSPALLAAIAVAFPGLDILDISLYWNGGAWPQVTDSMPRFTQLKELYLRRGRGKDLALEPMEMLQVRSLSRLIIAICPSEAKLILQVPYPTKPGQENVRRFCTSPKVVKGAVLEAFRKRERFTENPCTGLVYLPTPNPWHPFESESHLRQSFAFD